MLSPENLSQLRDQVKLKAIELKNSHHTKQTQDNINMLLDYIIQLEHLVVLADDEIKKITRK